MKIFSGSSNRKLAQDIAKSAGVSLGNITLKPFPSGERFCRFDENIRGEDVFLIQSTSAPANDNLMELFIMADAARRSSAGRLTAVIPSFGYARQDRKEQSRVPISAKLVMNLIKTAGFDRILTMDLHASQIVGFSDLPVDHLYFEPALTQWLKSRPEGLPDVIVSPDIGGVKRADYLAKILNCGLAICCKNRLSPTEVEIGKFIGDVNGKKVLIVDDLTESVNTLIESSKQCRQNGAFQVDCAITHGCFTESGQNSLLRALRDGVINRFYFSNTVNDEKLNPELFLEKVYGVPRLQSVDVSNLFGTAIRRISLNQSVSDLFAARI